MAIIKNFYRDDDGEIKVTLILDDGTKRILSLDEFDNEYAEHPELFTGIDPSVLRNPQNHNTYSNEKVSFIVIIIGFALLIFIMTFWEKIVKTLLMLPSIIIILEIFLSIYTLFVRIKDKKPFHLKSILYGLNGAIIGFGIAVIIILMYLIPLSMSNNLYLFNEMHSLNILFYTSIISMSICSICEDEKITFDSVGIFYIFAFIGVLLIGLGST